MVVTVWDGEANRVCWVGGVLGRFAPVKSDGNFEYTSDHTWVERNFPTQRAISYLWSGSDPAEFESALSGFMFSFGRLNDPRKRFDLEEPTDWTIEQMASSPIQMAFFTFLARTVGARRILEIGTFVGLGAMQLAAAVPADGLVVSVEKFPVFADIARRNVERNGLADRISILTGDLPSLVADGSVASGFDFVLLDGGKERYGEFLPICIDLLAPRGLIVMDNAFFLGDAVNEKPTTDKGRGVRASVEYARSRDDLDLSFVPFSDGILLIRRRGG